MGINQQKAHEDYLDEIKKLSTGFYSKLTLGREPLTFTISENNSDNYGSQIELCMFYNKRNKTILIDNTGIEIPFDENINDFKGNTKESQNYQIKELLKLSYNFYRQIAYVSDSIGYRFRDTKKIRHRTWVVVNATYINPENLVNIEICFDTKWDRKNNKISGDIYNFTINSNNQIKITE